MRVVLWRGPMALPFVLGIWAIGAFLLACPGAKDPMTPVDHLQVTEEGSDYFKCARDYRDAGRAAIEKCFDGVKASWDPYWDAALASDGGAP